MALNAVINKEEEEMARDQELQTIGGYTGLEALRGPLSRGIQEAAVWVATVQESTGALRWG